MVTRAVDSTIIGLVLIGLVYLGTVFLIIDIPIFNYVSPVSLAVVILAMFFGLAFGLFAGSWFTKEQLKLLIDKNEFRGLGSKQIYYALFLGLAVISACAFFAIYYRLLDLGNSMVVFTISATFTLFLSRLALIKSWEKKNRKTVMMDRNRIYTIPDNIINP
jgi:hypothetical protein